MPSQYRHRNIDQTLWHGELFSKYSSLEIMALTSEDILQKIMEKVSTTTDDSNTGSSSKKRFHVSQTADQLPDIKARNALYRADLERQIQDRREREKRRKELEELEEEKLLRKIERDRDKLRKEYLDEINHRNKSLEETRVKQQAIARRLEELQIEEARKRDEEVARKKQILLESLQIREIEEAKRREEELRRIEEEVAASRRKEILLEALRYKDYPDPLPTSFSSYFLRKPWNSQDYVHNGCLDLTLEEIYTTAPLHVLADVYRKLEVEKIRMREIIKLRIARGEEI